MSFSSVTQAAEGRAIIEPFCSNVGYTNYRVWAITQQISGLYIPAYTHILHVTHKKRRSDNICDCFPIDGLTGQTIN